MILCVAARNNISEYGGFSLTQALFPGYIPSDWSRLERPMTPEEKFQDESYKRILAQRAIQNSIYEERIRLGMRGKAPETDRETIEVGQQLEVFVKAKKKDEKRRLSRSACRPSSRSAAQKKIWINKWT